MHYLHFPQSSCMYGSLILCHAALAILCLSVSHAASLELSILQLSTFALSIALELRVPLNSKWIGQASYITLVDAGRRVEICNSRKNTFVTTHICGLLQQLHLEPRHIWLAPVGHTMHML